MVKHNVFGMHVPRYSGKRIYKKKTLTRSHHLELQSSCIQQMLGETLLELLKGIFLTEILFVLIFSYYVQVQKNNFKACFNGVIQVSAKCPKCMSEICSK